MQVKFKKLTATAKRPTYGSTGAAAGSRLMKFVSPGVVGVPDDILLNPIPPEHREIVARYFRFIEYKAPGAKPRPTQVREHARLRALGFTVDVIDQPNQLKP